MDGKKRNRSSLRKSIYAKDESTVVSCSPRGRQRRISFSGKHLVREFHREEEPRAWENSYEIYDHLNAGEVSDVSMAVQEVNGMTLSKRNETSQNTHEISNFKEPTAFSYDNTTLCIENSVNVTLFETEKRCLSKNKPQKHLEDIYVSNDAANCNSFSLNENEILALPNLRLNILGERTIDFMKDIINKKADPGNETGKIDYCAVNMCEDYMDKALCAKFTSYENKNIKEALTIYMNDSLSISKTEVLESKKNKDEWQTLNVSKDNKIVVSSKKTMYLDKENINPAISLEQNTTSNTSYFMDIENDSESSDAEISYEIDSNEFGKKIDQIPLLTNYDVKNDMIFKADEPNSEVKTTQIPTKNFHQTLNNSNIIPHAENIEKFPCSNGDMDLSTNVYLSKNWGKKCRPSKLVVRKIYTPRAYKSNNKKEMFHIPNAEADSLSTSVITKPQTSALLQNVPSIDNSLNFSLSNAKETSLSPETSSSFLIPSEYKSYNFKQLNDAFECGKIQLFSESNTVDRKTREYKYSSRNTSPELVKQMKTLFFEDDVSSDHSLNENYKHSDQRTNVRCRLSDADDFMMDHTSFLASAKLGDETISRNSTKIDIVNRYNDKYMFDGTHRQTGNKLKFHIADTKDENNTNFDSINLENGIAKNVLNKTCQFQNDVVDMELCDSICRLNEKTSEIHNCLEAENKVECNPKILHQNSVHCSDTESEIAKRMFGIIRHGGSIVDEGNDKIDVRFKEMDAYINNCVPTNINHPTIHLNTEIEEDIISSNDYDAYFQDNSIENNNFPEKEKVLPLNESFSSEDLSYYSVPHSTNSSKITLRTEVPGNKKGTKLYTSPDKVLVNRSRLFQMTPRLSLNEFLTYEKEVEDPVDQDVNNSKYKSPVRNENSNKRMPVNLTPLLSLAKKRQTLVFINCDMDESIPTNHVIRDIKEDKCSNADSNSDMDTSNISSREPVQQISFKEPKLSIQVPPSSVQSTFQIGDIDELQRSELRDEDGNSAHSIPEMRRATNSAYKHNIFDEHKSQVALEFYKTGRGFLFEDNPIAISDVSLCLPVHGSRTEDHCNITNVGTGEMKGKSFRKHYLNLTCDSELQDIDQTRICLVGTLSDEEVDERETNVEYSFQLRNATALCRKCKRCQETFLNESTSGVNYSFVLPTLLYVPPLDLDQLRRLRNKHIKICDANLLWHRVSLDRSVKSFNTISDQKTCSMFKACRDDYFSLFSMPIQKYVSQIQRSKRNVELHIYKSLSEKHSAINRIDDLFRIHSPNWIFDYQMQYRGTLIFTNKTISAFSLTFTYEENDCVGTNILLKKVKLEKFNTDKWTPLDYILHFQLKLSLPFDLLCLCECSDEYGILKVLQTINQECLEINQMGIKLQRILFNNQSTIISDEHRTFIRKIVRKPPSALNRYKSAENVEFRIEILNINKLCFKHIIMPSLYNFCEDIHTLPVGLSFLQEFLQKPLKYLKQS